MAATTSIKAIADQASWKHLPISIGKSAPRYNDLIQFEELDSYHLITPDEEQVHDAPQKKSTKASNKKRQRRKNREKLKALLKDSQKQEPSESDGIVKEDNDVKPFTNSEGEQAGLVNNEKPNDAKIIKNTKKRKNKQDSSDPNETKIAKTEAETTGELSDNNADVTSIQVDMSQWENLFVPDSVLKALSELNFTKPMPIQEEVLPAAIRDKRDVLGAAETGSGKTLAFGIPLIYHILEDKHRNLETIDEELSTDDDSDYEDLEPNEYFKDHQDESSAFQDRAKTKPLPALVLAPTRELALQVCKHLTKAAKYTGLRVVAVVGGMAIPKQVRLLKKQPDIVVATPGRLWELMDSGNAYLSNMHKLRYLVIDEADRMLERGHFEDLTKLLDSIKTDQGKKRQTFVFSATLTTIHLAPERGRLKDGANKETTQVKLNDLMNRIGVRSKPHIVDLTTKKVVAGTLTEAKIICESTEKDYYLYYFIKSHPGRTLIFTNSIDCIFHISGLLEAMECNPLHIHAKMQQRQRLKHLDRFQADPNALMIASDVAARGLDIPDVKYVIHYQTPRTMETYIHRSGRSARSGKDGLSLMFVSPDEMKFYKRICHSLKKETGLSVFVVDDSYMSAVRKRVNIAREIDRLNLSQKKVRLNNDWFSKAAKEMDLDLDDDVMMDTDGSRDVAYKIKVKKQQLTTLTQKPIFPKGFSGKYITQRGELLLPGLMEIGASAQKKEKTGKNKFKRKKR